MQYRSSVAINNYRPTSAQSGSSSKTSMGDRSMDKFRDDLAKAVAESTS